MIVTIIGSVLSAFGMTLSTLCTTSRMLAGMATTGIFPWKIGSWLSKRNKRFDTYHWAITLNTVLTALFSTLLDFGPLVKIDQFLYGIRVIMVFLAFFQFRRRYPLLSRPFKIPIYGWKLYVIFALPFCAFLALTVISMIKDVETVVFCVSIVSAMGLLSWLYCYFIHKSNFLGQIITVAF